MVIARLSPDLSCFVNKLSGLTFTNCKISSAVLIPEQVKLKVSPGMYTFLSGIVTVLRASDQKKTSIVQKSFFFTAKRRDEQRYFRKKRSSPKREKAN